MLLALVPLVVVAMNLVYSATAYPFGYLSDKMSRTKLLGLGIVVLAVSDFILAASSNWVMVLLAAGLWGIHMGMTQGLLAAMVAETAPIDLRGTAFGFYSLVSGLAMLMASGLAGFFWDKFGAAFTFFGGAGFCGLSLIFLGFCSAKFPALKA